MATVRRRGRPMRDGKEAWVADYFDEAKKRRLKTFRTKQAAETWLGLKLTGLVAGVGEAVGEASRGGQVRRIMTITNDQYSVPIPIRPDLTIYIQGLPFDLTELEARKLGAVIMALVQPASDG